MAAPLDCGLIVETRQSQGSTPLVLLASQQNGLVHNACVHPLQIAELRYSYHKIRANCKIPAIGSLLSESSGFDLDSFYILSIKKQPLIFSRIVTIMSLFKLNIFLL